MKTFIRWLRRYLWNPLAGTWRRFQQDDGSLMAAAMAFYAGLSMMPLLFVLASGFGMVLERTQFGADARQELLTAITVEGSPVIRAQVERVVDEVSQGAAIGGRLGFFGLLLGAMLIFAQFEKAFDRIWNVETVRDGGILKSIQHILLKRFRAFLMLCCLGLLVIAIFLTGLTISAIESFASQWWPVPYFLRQSVEWGASLALNAIAFTLLYRIVPKVEVRWREAAMGGLLVSVGWELGRQALSAFLIRTQYISAYGTIGAFLAVLIWLYYASHLVFLGAEFIQVICHDGGERVEVGDG